MREEGNPARFGKLDKAPGRTGLRSPPVPSGPVRMSPRPLLPTRPASVRVTVVAATAALAAVWMSPGALAAGPVVAWGSNVFNQRAVPGTLGPCLWVEGGGAHSIAVKQNGAVVAWGDNASGQCNVPATLGPCIMVDAGQDHSIALRTNGTVAAWGLNINGQGSVPATVGTCTRIAAGALHNLGLRTNGTIAAWGANFSGQCSVPVGLTGCKSVAAGDYHSLAIRSNDTVAAWGLNDYAQAAVPFNLGTVIAIAAGSSHSAAIRSDGGVTCWGSNGQGQRAVPAGLKACIGIACGVDHTVVLQQDGTVVAWGLSDFGQCTVPSNLPKSTQVAAGGSHSLALTTNVTAPTGVSATDGTSLTNVTVTWNAVAGSTGYRVFRAIGTGLGVQIGTTPGATTFVDSTAVAGVGYAYWIKTTTSLGDSAASVADAGWRNMAAPTGLTASDGTSTSGVNLSWTAVTGVTGYRVFRASGTATATQVGTSTGTTFTDTSAVAGTLYTYTVKSAGTGGDSAASTADNGWRGPALPAPSALAATDGSLTTGVQLTWNAVTGVDGYRVYRAIGSAAATEVTAPTVASYLDTAVTPGVTYTYTVKSRKGTANSAASAAETGWRALSAPANVLATDGTSTANVTVTWSGVTGSTGYKVFRATGTAAPAQVGTNLASTVTSFVDSTAVAGTPYSYTVKAMSAAGDSASSTANGGWRNIAAPTGTLATDGTSTVNVTITWNAATGATGYRVFRAIGSASPTQVGTTTAAVRTYPDTTAVAGTSYSYTVKAMTAAGDSLPSAANAGWRNVTAPTGVTAAGGTSVTQVRISWSIHPDTAVTGYLVFRSIGGAAPTLLADVAGRTTTGCDDTSVAQAQLASYTVQAKTPSGTSLASAAATGWRNVPAPLGVSATQGTSTQFVKLTWTASPSTAVTDYRVVRRLPGETTFKTLGTVTGRTEVTYFDGSINPMVQGTYAVHALTPLGPSPVSALAVGFRASGGSGAMPTPGGSVAGGTSNAGDGATGIDAGAVPGASAHEGTAGGGAGTGLAGTATSAAGGVGATATPLVPGPADGHDVSCADIRSRLTVLAMHSLRLDRAEDADRLTALLSPAAADEPCPACRMLAGDVTLDGTVDADDLAAFMDAWQAGDLVVGDLDRDGLCDGGDLARIVVRLGGAAAR